MDHRSTNRKDATKLAFVETATATFTDVMDEVFCIEEKHPWFILIFLIYY